LDNIISYLKWRGDLLFDESPFNEVDNLILCAFTYIKLKGVLKENEKISLKDLYSEYTFNNDIFLKNQKDLFRLLSKSKRFQNIIITKFINEISEKEEKQFCALTFILPNNQLFIGFGGTDDTLVGWKEDFNMSYQKSTPSHIRAVEYLEEILNHTNKNVIIGGHSKGGNLAMYASLFCNVKLQNKILKVYNNDGPGLNIKKLSSKNTFNVQDKIITFIPKSSIIGNFFSNDSKIIVVKSSSFGLMQHDLYSWVVDKDKFLYAQKMDSKTKEIANYLNKTIDNIPDSQKEKIIKFIYDFINSLNIPNLENISKNLVNKSLINKYNLDINDLKLLKDIIPLIIKIWKNFY